MTVNLAKGLRDALHSELHAAFPDAALDDADVEGFALALQRHIPNLSSLEKLPDAISAGALEPYRPALDALARSVAPGALDATGSAPIQPHPGDPFGYYWVTAIHSRKVPQNYEPFEGHLAMVRVRLPERDPRRFSSAIGSIEPADHLISTVREANDKYANALGYPLQRVELVTPPRQLLRFGAISVLLGYRDASAFPTCYVLEAGTALGQSRVIYLGKTLDAVVNRRTGYKPTTFSCSDNAYTGQLEVVGHEPRRLHVTARDIIANTSSAAPYIDLDVRFERQTGAVRTIWPGFLIARAALIVAERRRRGLTNTCEDT
jgi:hypothetical protein